MNLTQLTRFAEEMFHADINPQDIIIEGKGTNRISFTLSFRQIQDLDKVCVTLGWTWSTSHDEFLAKGASRIQLDILRYR